MNRDTHIEIVNGADQVFVPRKFFYAECDVDALHKKSLDINGWKLALEFHYRNGLQLVDIRRETSDNHDIFCLTASNGVPVGHAFVSRTVEGPEFSFYTPAFPKQRGESDSDRHTYCSKKMNYLFASLKKARALNVDGLVYHFMGEVNEHISSCKALIQQRVGTNTKTTYGFDAEIIHDLFRKVVRNDPVALNMDTLTSYLEQFDKVDQQQVEATIHKESIFGRTFWGIGIGSRRVYVSKYKLAPVSTVSAPIVHDNNTALTQVGDMRVIEPSKMAESFPELVPLLLMMKVSHEKNAGKYSFYLDSTVPVADIHYKELDAVQYYRRSPGEYSRIWLFAPTGE